MYEQTTFRRNDTEGLAQEAPKSGCFPSFDSSLSKHLHMITANHYTHFLQHCPAYPSFIVLVISSVVPTDSSQLHASDFRGIWRLFLIVIQML